VTLTHTGPGGGTQRLHQKYIAPYCNKVSLQRQRPRKGQRQCTFDGADIRIDRCEDEVEFTVLAYVIQPKLLDANDNFAPSEFALAA